MSILIDTSRNSWRICPRCNLPIGDLEAMSEGVTVKRKGEHVGIAHAACAKEGTLYRGNRSYTVRWVVFDDEDTFEPPLVDFARE